MWQWHFYAGLFCIPFLIVLATSGSMYLFKTQVEARIDRPYDLWRSRAGPPAPTGVRAALAALPGSTLDAYEMPKDAPASAARVIVRGGGGATRVLPPPGELAGPEEGRRGRPAHDESCSGSTASCSSESRSALVELAASSAVS